MRFCLVVPSLLPLAFIPPHYPTSVPVAVIILGRDVLLSLAAFYIRYTSLPPPVSVSFARRRHHVTNSLRKRSLGIGTSPSLPPKYVQR